MRCAPPTWPASPVVMLAVPIGKSPAGAGLPTARSAAGEAVRIFTGAPLPAGADAIVIQEDTEADETTSVVVRPPPGPLRAAAGLDFSAGDSSAAGRPRADRPRRRPRRGHERALADGAAPAARRDPGHRRRDRDAGRPDRAEPDRRSNGLALAGWSPARRRADPPRASRLTTRRAARHGGRRQGRRHAGHHRRRLGRRPRPDQAMRWATGARARLLAIAMRPGKPLIFGRISATHRCWACRAIRCPVLVCAMMFLRRRCRRDARHARTDEPTATAQAGRRPGRKRPARGLPARRPRAARRRRPVATPFDARTVP